MNIFAKITCQTMKQNKIRTIASIIGVILATSMVTGVLVFGGSVQNYMLERGKRENGEWHLYEEALTKEEYEAGHLEDAINIPYMDIHAIAGNYLKDKKQ